MKKHKCYLCKCQDSKDNPVTWDVDPYDDDVNGDDTKHWICGECSYERSQEI